MTAPVQRPCTKDHAQLTTKDVSYLGGLGWSCLECRAVIRETALVGTGGEYRPGWGNVKFEGGAA